MKAGLAMLTFLSAFFQDSRKILKRCWKLLFASSHVILIIPSDISPDVIGEILVQHGIVVDPVP